jgi:1,4-alpha-glucan branching enzyme
LLGTPRGSNRGLAQIKRRSGFGVKRSEALRWLSQDHHQALRIAQHLRRAEDAGQTATAFLEFWRREGREHFRIEEELLLPLWALFGTVDDAAAARLSREHLAIRRAALAAEKETPSLPQLHALGEQLAAHVRFEERELFVLIEEDLRADDLKRLALAVAETSASAEP